MPQSKTAATRTRNLPAPPSIWHTLGPSFILLGLALGSGELILWPYLAAQFGLGILWGGLLGITFQFVLNTETMRYTLAWGESVFVGFRRLSWFIPVWYIISTFIPWSLPGFSSASAEILSHTLGNNSFTTLIAVGLLIFTGVILTVGKVLYKTMELLQRSIVLLGLPFMIVIASVFTNETHWMEALWGLVGKGEGWWFFPQGIVLSGFLGAFAYSGAGGNLNLAQSYYVKGKGWGMGKFASKVTSLLATDEVKIVALEGQRFAHSPANAQRWRQWWRTVNFEHGLLFWMLGLLTIITMAVISHALVFGKEVSEGIGFLYAEAALIGQGTAPYVGTFFLLVAALMLFSTQVGVLESSSRIISENVLLLFYKRGRKFNLSMAFYGALWSQIILGIIMYVSGFNEPRYLLTLSAILNAAAMAVSFPLIYILNARMLHTEYQPGLVRKGFMIAAFGFFTTFLVITFQGILR